MADSSEQRLILRFSGLAPDLSFQLQANGLATMDIRDRTVVDAHDAQGRLLDMIADFDLFEEISADGHSFCRHCEPPTLYSTRYELWQDHVFEKMLGWINQLRPGDWICVHGGGTHPGCSGAALIRSRTEDLDLERLRDRRDRLNSLLGIEKSDASQPICKRSFPLVEQEQKPISAQSP
jgi:hypothetical protein